MIMLRHEGDEVIIFVGSIDEGMQIRIKTRMEGTLIVMVIVMVENKN